MLISATWMMALNGSLPADVSMFQLHRRVESGIGPLRFNSWKGASPPRRFIAPEIP